MRCLRSCVTCSWICWDCEGRISTIMRDIHIVWDSWWLFGGLKMAKVVRCIHYLLCLCQTNLFFRFFRLCWMAPYSLFDNTLSKKSEVIWISMSLTSRFLLPRTIRRGSSGSLICSQVSSTSCMKEIEIGAALSVYTLLQEREGPALESHRGGQRGLLSRKHNRGEK